MIRFSPIVLMLALSACQPEIPAGEPAAAPSSAVPALQAAVLGGIDLSQPLKLVGTEPFWGIQVDGGKAVYSSPEESGKPYNVTDFTVEGETVKASGEGLNIVLTAVKCSDGMSDREYPLTAEVVLDGKTLKGCAATT